MDAGWSKAKAGQKAGRGNPARTSVTYTCCDGWTKKEAVGLGNKLEWQMQAIERADFRPMGRSGICQHGPGEASTG